MCVIVVKPAGVKLKRAYWHECFRINGHGAGLSYVEDNKLVVDKGYFEFEDLYKEIVKHEDKEMVVHFRISSAGAVNFANCHPFYVESVAFPRYSWSISHNGTLDYRSTKDESDTNLFVNEVLGPQLEVHPWFLDDHPGQWFLKKACENKHANSKIVVFRYDNEKKESKIYIANKNLGTEEMGCWFSNTSFRLPYVYTGRYGGMGGHHMGDYEGEDERFFGKAGFMSDKDWSRHGYHQNAEGRWVSNRHRVIQVRQAKLLPPAAPLSQQQEQQKTNAELARSDSSVTKSSNSNVVVPRDDEVRAARNKEIRFNSRLDHLTKKGKRILRRLASDYAKETLPEDVFARMTIPDLVQDFRDNVRYHAAGHNGDLMMMEDKLLDQWIVDQYHKCNSDPALNLGDQLGLAGDTTYEREPITEDGPDEIDEAVAADANLGGKVEQFPRQAELAAQGDI